MEDSFVDELLVMPDVSPLPSLSRSFASLEILPGGGLLVSRPPLPLELRRSSRPLSLSFPRSSRLLFLYLRSSSVLSFCLRSSRLLSFSRMLPMDGALLENPFSSLFFLTRLAAPPRTVVALWSIEMLPERPCLE